MQTPRSLLLASLSYDSWSEKREKAAISAAARSALSQIGKGGKIVASSLPIGMTIAIHRRYGAKRETKRSHGEQTERFMTAQGNIRRANVRRR